MLKDAIESLFLEKERFLKEKYGSLESKLKKVFSDFFSEISEKIPEFEKEKISTIYDELFSNYKEPKPEKIRIRTLNDIINKISISNTQNEIISSYLEGINNLLSRAAIFVLKENSFIGWHSAGFAGKGGVQDSEIRNISIPLKANTVFREVIEKEKTFLGDSLTHPDNWLIFSKFGGKKPETIIVLPLTLKNKPSACIYGDQVPFEKEIDSQGELEILTKFLEMSLAILPFKQKLLDRDLKRKTLDLPPQVPEAEIAKNMDKIEEMHKDAKKLAKILISEIMFSYRKEIMIGRKKGDLAERLKEVLEKNKEIYVKNVHPDILKTANYFWEEAVNVLAEGDGHLLKQS
ncbi:MAG: hypothetical protein AB1410_02995 [Acidobacteriota bacterium]